MFADKIDGAWIVDAGPNVDLWFTTYEFFPVPELTFKKNNGREDLDVHWLWFWFGYTRRYHDGRTARKPPEGQS